MSTKTSELTGVLLDYWVARTSPQFADIVFEAREGHIACLAESDGEMFVAAFMHDGNVLATMRLKRKYQHAIRFSPSTDWAQGGLIIESERIATVLLSGKWCAFIDDGKRNDYEAAAGYIDVDEWAANATGPTPLVAAMRAYVVSKFGDEVAEVDHG